MQKPRPKDVGWALGNDVEPGVLTTLLLLLLAAFGGGVINAAAGGGTFLTLPALILAGVPPVAANATGNVSFVPGYIASVWGFKEDLVSARQVSLWLIIIASLLGGIAGAWLLVVTPNAVFAHIVPWLILVSTIWFALAPWLDKHFKRQRQAGLGYIFLGVFTVSVYGGYFNGGLGIVVLAALSAMGLVNLNYMNGLKGLIAAVLSAVAVLVYAFGGAVVWHYALIMILGTVVGGYVGARWARRLPEWLLRLGIVVIGLMMSAVFFFGFGLD